MLRRKALLAFACAGLAGVAIAVALLGGDGRPAASPVATEERAENAQTFRSETTTLRQAVDEIGRRLGARTVIDDAVGADLPAPRIPPVALDATRLEALLRTLLAGHPHVVHYGDDGRVRAVWVYAREAQIAVGRTDAAAARPEPPAATRAPPSAPPSEPHETPAATLQDLRQVVETDASDAVRMQALDAYVMQPDASDAEIAALLERLSSSGDAMLAEHARVLRDTRAAVPTAAALVPEPVEDGR